MTKRECAIVMAFTGTAMLKGDDLNIFYQYLSEIMGRPVYTHEIGILADEIKESARADFIRLCSEADGRRTITNGDRIRQMTDEELADWLNDEACYTCNICIRQNEKSSCYDYSCEEYVAKWLKQEAKEVAED